MYASHNPNTAYDIFIEYFKLFYDLCFPLRLVTIKAHKKSDWVSRGIKICSKKKRQLLWAYRIKRTTMYYHNYINYKRKFRKIISLTKKAQNNYKIKISNNKSKATWQIINNTKQNIPRGQIDEIKINNQSITNPTGIANSFNKFFY